MFTNMKENFKLNTNIIALVAVVFISVNAIGQSINLSGGVNFTTFNFYDEGAYYSGDYSYMESESYSQNPEYEYSYESKRNSPYTPSASFGLSFEYRFKNHLAFESGVIFSNKAYKRVGITTYNSQDNETRSEEIFLLRTNYIDLPVMLKFNFFDKGLRVYGNGGMFFGVCLSGKEIYTSYYDYSGDISTDKDEDDFDVEDNDFRITAGLIGGLGVEWKGIFIESNYMIGAMNLSKIDDELILGNTILLSAGYKFKFNKDK